MGLAEREVGGGGFNTWFLQLQEQEEYLEYQFDNGN